jgi:hypothetical protein
VQVALGDQLSAIRFQPSAFSDQRGAFSFPKAWRWGTHWRAMGNGDDAGIPPADREKLIAES